MFRHEAFGKEVYYVEWSVNVTKEGPVTDIFVAEEGALARKEAR